MDSTGLMPSDHLFRALHTLGVVIRTKNGCSCRSDWSCRSRSSDIAFEALHVHVGNAAAPMHLKLGTGASSWRAGRKIGYLISRNSFPWCSICFQLTFTLTHTMPL